MMVKVNEKEYCFDGYVSPLNSIQKLAEDVYKQGRADREKELEKAFNILFGSEYSWYEVIAKAEQLKQ